MTPTRPGISPKVLAELARKVHPELVTDDGKLVHRTFFSTAQHWAVLLIVGAWAVMLLVAPLLLLLLLVRVNYTAQWLVSAFWLLGISFVVGGLLMIADWIEQYIHRKPRDDTALFAGIGIVITILIIGFLLWQGANDVIHPLVTFGLMALLSTLFVVWGIYRLIADRQTRLVVRVVYLLAMLCLGAGLLIASISLKQEFVGIAPDTYRTLSKAGFILSPLGWALLLFWQVGRVIEQPSWSKRTVVLLIATIIVAFAFVALLIWR
jgi:hypothetical protein